MTAPPDFFDTNILIAASVGEHVHHEVANARLAKLASAHAACSAHTLAEAYTNLTKISGGYGRSPSDTLRILQYAEQTFTLITLTPRETLQAIQGVARLGLPGAIVYDALILACARKIKATHIYTLNPKHFRQIAPDLAAIILHP